MEFYKFFNAENQQCFFSYSQMWITVWVSIQTECSQWFDAENKLFLTKRFIAGKAMNWWTFSIPYRTNHIFLYGGYKSNADLLEGFTKCFIWTLLDLLLFIDSKISVCLLSFQKTRSFFRMLICHQHWKCSVNFCYSVSGGISL